MKHEAFVDAVSMLDDDIIAEAQEPFRRKIHARLIVSCSAAAACAAVLGAILLLPERNGADILVMGKDISDGAVVVGNDSADGSGEPAVRACSFEMITIPVTISASEPAVVSISSGELFSQGTDLPAETPLEISESTSLVWNVLIWDATQEFTLTVQTGDNCRTLMVSFDDSMQEWTVKEAPDNTKTKTEEL